MQEQVILNDRYYIDERLGSGGMAMVYLARDMMLERRVAIKILRQDFSRDPEFRDQFHREARAAANLSHPNIVTVYDFGLQEDRLYIVMEYVPGTDLKAILRRDGRFEMNDAITLMLQACDGIGHAHRSGLVHCDIKPQNLLVTQDQRLKVVDFGIARALATVSPDEKYAVVWGSPKYFSPEQARGSAPSPASDVYSLGVVFFEMLTGQLPFLADSSEELARQHRELPPPSLRKLNPLIPVQIEEFLLNVLSKEPSARYRNADQMGLVLAGLTQFTIGIPALTTVNDTDQEQHASAPQEQVESVQSQDVTTTKPSADRGAIRSSRVRQNVSRSDSSISFDWITWILTLLALITVGGLIPFWLWVFYIVYPPV
jgi:serine/threonine-protein kinase